MTNESSQAYVPIETKTPNLVGPAAIGWELGDEGFFPHNIGKFLLKASNFHPLIQYYFFSLISLKHPDIETVPPHHRPRIIVPGATYELGVYAVDPQKGVYVGTPVPILTPHTFAAQWYCSDDEQAHDMFIDAIVDVLSGELNPMPVDGKSAWVSRFGYSPYLAGALSIQDVHQLNNFVSDVPKQ